jgi:hypothetical protein
MRRPPAVCSARRAVCCRPDGGRRHDHGIGGRESGYSSPCALPMRPPPLPPPAHSYTPPPLPPPAHSYTPPPHIVPHYSTSTSPERPHGLQPPKRKPCANPACKTSAPRVADHALDAQPNPHNPAGAPPTPNQPCVPPPPRALGHLRPLNACNDQPPRVHVQLCAPHTPPSFISANRGALASAYKEGANEFTAVQHRIVQQRRANIARKLRWRTRPRPHPDPRPWP